MTTDERSMRLRSRLRRLLAMGTAAAAMVLALSGPGSAAAPVASEPSAGPAETVANVMAPGGPLVATDALGRELADHTEAPPPREDRTVGVFYVLWHGSNDMREYKNVFDNNATLAEDPLAWQTPDSGAFPGPGHFAYWGEPLYGYFRSDDAWVVRRDLQLLAAAQVDYLVLDASNWEVYKPQAILLMRTIVELQSQGVRAPQVVFMTHTESSRNMDEIYRTFYADDAPHRYPSTWFHWDGKPLIMGVDPSRAVQEFFTFRYAQWPNEPQQPADGWDWISFDRPQRGNHDAEGNLEQMAVSPAQNSGSSSIFSYTAWYGLDDPPSRSRSFHDGAEDESPGAENHGFNFQEQWDHAIEADPETILVLEWNEWIAGNWAARPSDPLVFYDVVNTRWSRDLAPMTGGYGDNYYLQLVDNIRRYKGVEPPADTGGEHTIDLRGGFAQWRDVSPEYADYQGDTAHRDHPGVDARTYVNRTGRNDIVSAKVARDSDNVYFYVRTHDELTDASDEGWMTLYLDADSDGATGWSGYDLRVRWHGEEDARLERFTVADGWQTVRESLSFTTGKDELMVAVPRAELGGSGEPLRLGFKWWDNQQSDDIVDAYVSGDAAPDGRFSYLYDTGDHPAAGEPTGPPAVEPLPEQASGWYRIEDDDPTTDYEAHVTPEASSWVTVADPESSGGTHSYLYNPGGRPDAFFRSFIRTGFEGNAVRWVAPAGPQGTEAEVFVDGLSQGVVNLYSERSDPRRTVFEVRGLPDGQHEIMVVFKAQSGTYYHDYFEYGVGAAGRGGDLDTSNLADAAYATASSFAPAQWFATNAGQVNDGSVGTYWRGTQEAGDHVELSFGRTVPFDRIDVVPRTADATVTSFEVRLHDARGWRTVHRGGELDAATTIELGTTRADAVQLVVTGTTGAAPELAEIRVRSGRDPAVSPSGTSWEFAESTDGWTGEGPLGGPEWAAGGTIGGVVDGAGAALLSAADLEIDAGELRSVLVELQNRTTAREAHLRYVATTPDGRTVTGRRPFRIAADSGYTAYVVDLTDAPGWSGTIRQIGIEVSADEGRLDLGHVRLAPDHAVYAAHFAGDDLDGWTAPGATSGPDGSIGVPLDGVDDELRSPPDLRADITNADTVTLRLRNDSSAAQGVVRFTTTDDPEGTEHAVPFDITAHDEAFTTYQVSMDTVPEWRGLLESLAVELVGAEPGQELRLDTVRVEPFVLTSVNTKRTWTFDESAEGWGQAGNIDGFGWRDGGVGGTIVGPDPQFYSAPGLWLDLTELTTVSIRMAVDTSAMHGTLYFTTEAEPNFSESKSIRIPLVPGETGYVDYELDLSTVGGWTGVLRQLRLDPEEGDSTGTFHVDHVELLPVQDVSAKEPKP
ncbi:discoidin domain-containing protein [Jiangella asiatica]|uniref:Discoidin domain-containing protein n=1 Tax=Jiangella asiatica TaxID=2530372 RepID=A0A4R5DGP2_9ACTN|nr:discoidin domain-containing protein [Jiangella asiatica]TDE09885.1 discoidin domain-containing protein [Jiangella asiatica]